MGTSGLSGRGARVKRLWLCLLVLPLFAEWTFLGTSEWKETEADGEKVLYLHKVGPVPRDPVRRPAGIALLPGGPVGAFTLDFRARSMDFHKRGADICLVFDFRGESDFSYAHVSNDSNGTVHTVIMRVKDGSRHTIHLEKDPPPALRDNWQHFRLVLRENGTVLVFVDDMETPHLTAKIDPDATGRVGVGSFDDRVQFKDIQLKERR